MRFDDAKTYRQSDPHADSCRLGGEIGLEYPRAKMGRDARPVVGDGDAKHLRECVEMTGEAYAARQALVLQ